MSEYASPFLPLSLCGLEMGLSEMFFHTTCLAHKSKYKYKYKHKHKYNSWSKGIIWSLHHEITETEDRTEITMNFST